MKKVTKIILLFILILLVGIVFADPKFTVFQGRKYKGETTGNLVLVNTRPTRNRLIVKYCPADITYTVDGKEYKALAEVTSDMALVKNFKFDIKVNYMEDSPEKIMLKDVNNKVVLKLYVFYLAIVLVIMVICKVINKVRKKKNK